MEKKLDVKTTNKCKPRSILSPDLSTVKISRRGFLKGNAALAGALLLWDALGEPAKGLAREINGWPDRYGMLTDLTRCFGCRICEKACNKANDLEPPATPFEDKSVFEEKRRVNAHTNETYTVVNRYADPKTGEPVYRKVQCNHCAEPACASACPVSALKKSPDGPVLYNENLCIGCRYCMTACPFYVPAFEYFDAGSPAIRKCSMCYTRRISKGEVPACASECPVEAITFGKRSELIKLAREKIVRNPDKYIDHIYGENEFGGTDWLYISGIAFEEMDFPSDTGTTPLPEFTREFLSAVPLVLVMWPALFGGVYLFSKNRSRTAEAGTENTKKEGNQS
ncbi:MAG: 4Fe-4S dicluster domain-containing protein [Dehalococcoidia bacterium]|nr:4Fe-4S dicluster domain-containing protein [Dehalococcoidia bacterium]